MEEAKEDGNDDTSDFTIPVQEDQSTLVARRDQILAIRNMVSANGPIPISYVQRMALATLFRFQHPGHDRLRLENVANGFSAQDPTVYIVDRVVCTNWSTHRFVPGDIVTYKVSFHGLEGIILGVTEDHSKVAILNLNYEDERFIVEHYSAANFNGGFPNRNDRRQITDRFDDWILRSEDEQKETDSESVSVESTEEDQKPELLNGETLVVTKEDIVKIRNLTPDNGHLPIHAKQRKRLYKLLRLHSYDHSYLRIEGLRNGLGEEDPTEYCVVPKVCRSFGNHGLNPGDIITYSVSFDGLEGMVIGITRDRKKLGILNVNYGHEKYILEHYRCEHVFGGHPAPRDKRTLSEKFIDRGMKNSEVHRYHDEILVPFLEAAFTEWFPLPVVHTVALYVAEMSTVEDFSLSLKSKSNCCIS